MCHDRDFLFPNQKRHLLGGSRPQRLHRRHGHLRGSGGPARGDGVFEDSTAALKMLNEVRYGKEDSIEV